MSAATNTIHDKRFAALTFGWQRDAAPAELAAMGAHIAEELAGVLPDAALDSLAKSMSKRLTLPTADRLLIVLALAVLSLDRPAMYPICARIAAGFEAEAFEKYRLINKDPGRRADAEISCGGDPRGKLRTIVASTIRIAKSLLRRRPGPGAA